MALRLRCAFILVLLVTAALGDARAKEGPRTAAGASKNGVLTRPRSIVLGTGSVGGAGQRVFVKEESLQPQSGGLTLARPADNSINASDNCNQTS
ncbi:hypothetical protein ERJ75_001229200 [Trypanosoma vivax]|nr:hypothetical protein ERJ75_001229200 [Trypanosoma vivax]